MQLCYWKLPTIADHYKLKEKKRRSYNYSNIDDSFFLFLFWEKLCLITSFSLERTKFNSTKEVQLKVKVTLIINKIFFD